MHKNIISSAFLEKPIVTVKSPAKQALISTIDKHYI
jgi:hypothetical protein